MPDQIFTNSKPCVIFIEHDYYIRELYEEILDSKELEVLVFASAIPALKAIRKYKPILIFVDIDLPGSAALKLLKQIDQEKIKSKVVLLSNYEGKDIIKKYLGQQVENVIETSNASPDDVIKLIHKILVENRK